MKHLLSIEKLAKPEIERILGEAVDFKKRRKEAALQPLA